MVKRIVAACIFVPILFVIMVVLPPAAMGVLVAVIAGMAAYELMRASAKGAGKVMKGAACLCAAILPLSFIFGLPVGRGCTYLLTLLLMCVAFLLAIRAYDEQQKAASEWVLLSLFAGILIPLLLSALVMLRSMENGRAWVLVPVVIAFTADAGAYFAGMFLGKHRGLLRVSPNKSVEGFVGGFLIGTVCILLYGAVLHFAFALPVNFVYLLLYGVAGSAVTELGDLSFSLIKREYAIKDYGHILMGHGGMLDRFDSMIFCAPVIYAISVVLPAIG